MVTSNELLAQQLLGVANTRTASPLARGLAGFFGTRNLRIAEQQKQEEAARQREALATQLGLDIDPAALEALGTQGLREVLASQLTREPAEPIKLGAGEVLVSPTTGEQIAVAPQSPLELQKVETAKAQAKKFNLQAKEIENKLKQGKPINFKDTTSLRKEFLGASKDFIAQRDAYQRILATAANPSPANDIALIFSIMKINDPTSVVREGEFATAQNAAGIPERLRNVYNRALEGTRLNDKQRQDFIGSAGSIFNAALSQHNQRVSNYRNLATQANLDPDQVTIDVNLSGQVGADPQTSVSLPVEPTASTGQGVIKTRIENGRLVLQ